MLNRLFFSVKPIYEEGDHVMEEIAYYTNKMETVYRFEIFGDELTLKAFDIDGDGSGSVNRRIYTIMKFYGEYLAKKYNVKKVTVQGGKRTTGAKPGRIPSPVVIFGDRRAN